jgi:hypothetical protein
MLTDLRDPDVGVRASTVNALERFGGTDMIPALQEIARSDPASEKTDNGGERCPIREYAAKAIDAIQKRSGQH